MLNMFLLGLGKDETVSKLKHSHILFYCMLISIFEYLFIRSLCVSWGELQLHFKVQSCVVK